MMSDHATSLNAFDFITINYNIMFTCCWMISSMYFQKVDLMCNSLVSDHSAAAFGVAGRLESAINHPQL